MMQLVGQKLRAGVPPPWEWAVVQRWVSGIVSRAGAYAMCVTEHQAWCTARSSSFRHCSPALLV